MKIGVPKEIVSGETRVASTPEMVKKLLAKGFEVCIERGAGHLACYDDAAYEAAEAQLVDTLDAFSADLVIKVRAPTLEEIGHFKQGAVFCALLEPCENTALLERLAEVGVTAFAMEAIPRTTRAQGMDVLSSQANIAGYRAVVEGAGRYVRFFPMMMTAAGAARPARVVVLGAGVAGLQAIATARRLGAEVEAFDVRPTVKEEIQSLGAKFIELDLGESGAGEGGYARELTAEAKERQQKALTEYLKKANVIISTALIPCKAAPVLITEEAVKGLAEGSVIIDMAAANGGNCPLTKAGEVITAHGVTIVGFTNYPALVPTDASAFYARNMLNLLSILVDTQDDALIFKDFSQDDITRAAMVTHQGKVLYQPQT
ncbi:MAG: Re/Si-specific NAD(P)(+) transhydrogenase subunit alpha [Gammaproteobacteria bacterium]|jgi:NAD(P) transhydrogenase subunit alpha